jgi:uncharacterized protein YfaS (alpha-2-macroglobulin family)
MRTPSRTAPHPTRSTMTRGPRARVVVALTALLSLWSGGAHAGRFYLSTERVFAPGQAPSVKLEANGLTSLDVRVYKLDDPRAWFDAQRDLHRPAVTHASPRPKTTALLSRGARFGLERLLLDVRKRFGDEGREALKGVVPDVHAAAMAGVSTTVPHEILPPLEGHALLDAWRVSLPARDGWVYDEVAIPVRDPGAYLVEALADGQVGYAVVLVSNVALVTKQSSTQLLVWAIDPASGEPRAGTKVTVQDGGKPVDEGRTDADGLVRFALGLKNTPVLYAENGASFTLLDPRFYSANLPEPRVYLFTERPVYRPAQEVFFKGFAREIVDERYEAPREGTAVNIVVTDPTGKSVHETMLALSDRGSFDGRFVLPPDVTMGTWQIVATIDDKRYAGQFKVMSYVKPEVRLTVRLDDKVARAGDQVAGQVEGAYFFGAPYRKAEVKLTLTRTRLHIPWYVDVDYAWYFSESEYQNTKREVLNEWTCVLDDQGFCPFEVATKADSEDFTYVVEAAALDPTGRTISGQTTLTVTEGAFRLAFDQTTLIRAPGYTESLVVVVEDHDRRPRAGTEVTLTVRARHATKDGEPETVEVLRETRAADADGRVNVDVKLTRGGYYEVTATAKDDRGTAITADTFIFASEGAGELPFSPPDVEIVTDKRSYFAGEKALVLVLAPEPAAHVLFTVEGGDLYRADVQRAKNHAFLATVDIGEKQTPNFFLSATTVSGGRVYTKQRSVVVPPREKLLVVEVSPDRTDAKPGESVDFTVTATDHAGKPAKDAEVALSVVDEAIYAVSPEIAVPLESFFHHRKRNDVRTEESVSFRFFGTSRGLRDVVTGDAQHRPFAFGSMKPQLDDVRKVFKDTAAFFPSLVTDGEGRARVSVLLPDNLTSWRATARVMSRATAVGMAVGHVRVKKPLIVRVALPPRLVEGDRGQGALVVQNLTDGPLSVDTSVVATSAAGGALALVRDGSDTAWPARIDVAANATVRLPLTYVAERAGALTVAAKASGGALSDALESAFVVESATTQGRVSVSGRVGSDRANEVHTLTLPSGTRLKDAVIEVELAPSALAAVERVLPHLVEFPYGCTEQTMSRFLPALAARAASARLSVPQDALLAKSAGAPLDAARLARVVDAGRERLMFLQRDDGGWGWWEEGGSDAFMTAWVLEGLAEAKSLGVVVDDARIASGADVLIAMLARAPLAMSDETRALALYALARVGKPQISLVRTLAAKIGDAHVVTTALVTLAAAESGDAALAKKLAARVATAALATANASSVDEAGIVRAEHHPTEALAWSTLALVKTGTANDVVTAATDAMLAHLESGAFGTTRQTALVVRAIAMSLASVSKGASRVQVLLDGQPLVDESFDDAARVTSRVVKRPRALTTNTVKITVTGDGAPVFYAVAVTAPLQAKEIKADGARGFAVKRTFYALSGGAGAWTKGAPVTQATTGDTMLVELEVMSPRELTYVMLEDPRPAGLSPIERDGTLLVDGIDLRISGAHREHRDDKTAFFVSRVGPGRTRFYYLVRAGLPGTFRGLPARVEAMYTPAAAHARSASSVLEVTAP